MTEEAVPMVTAVISVVLMTSNVTEITIAVAGVSAEMPLVAVLQY